MKNHFKLKALALLICGGMSLAAVGASNSKASSNTMNLANGAATVTPNDAKLTTAVNSALTGYAAKVTISVKEGVVSLSGQVASDTDYEKVVTLSKSVKGVVDVNVDKLKVKDSANSLYDSYITAKVRGALIQADLMGADIPSWSISVETKDGQVYLSGKIATDKELQKVIETVKKVKGVTKVHEKIEAVSTTGPATATPAATTTVTPGATIPVATDTDDSNEDDSDLSGDSGDEENDSDDAGSSGSSKNSSY